MLPLPPIHAAVRALVLLSAVAIAGVACRPPAFDFGLGEPRTQVADGWRAMGTEFAADLRLPPREVDDARVWLDAQRAEIARLESIYSRHVDASALSALNAALRERDVLRSGARIGPELEAILFEALEIWEGSAGAFDPTVGPLVDLWAEAARRGTFPGLERVRATRRRVGAQSLLLPGEGVVGVTLEGVQLDLDGLARGVVLDRIGADFRATFPNAAALLRFGERSVFAIGDPDGRARGGGWRLEVRSRDDRRTRLATIQLRDLAMSVSSSLEETREIGATRVSKVIDPRTAVAVERAVEAVVVSPRAGLADGWSTALLVLGAQRESMRLVDRAELEAYVFEKAGRIAASEGWETLEAEPAPRAPVEAGPGIRPVGLDPAP
ncbi:MAG: FAD:protein FMN transferase [Myxococcota bacterium]